jgi:hypothetical protein
MTNIHQQHQEKFADTLADLTATELIELDSKLLDKALDHTLSSEARSKATSERLAVSERIAAVTVDPRDEFGFTRLDEPEELSPEVAESIAAAQAELDAQEDLRLAQESIQEALDADETPTDDMRYAVESAKEQLATARDSHPVLDRLQQAKTDRGRALDLRAAANELETLGTPELQNQVGVLRGQADELEARHQSPPPGGDAA